MEDQQSHQDRLIELFVRWDNSRDTGLSLTLEEVCIDCPELLPELREFVAEVRIIRSVLQADIVSDPAEHQLPSIEDGRFRPISLHRAGGMGIVFVAEDLHLGRTVALKCMRGISAELGGKNFQQRFEREAVITGKLEHPGIVPIYGIGQDATGKPYYAMRFIQGRSFREVTCDFFAKEGRGVFAERGEFKQLVRHLISVCETVAYTHDRGVVHRDLKPENIMVGPYGETLIVDWGLAKCVGRTESPPEAVAGFEPLDLGGAGVSIGYGPAKGSPEYMSPEQAQGAPDNVGPASDIFSLGGILYFLLTAQHPYEGDQALDKAKQRDCQPPRQVRHKAPAALEAICLKAMAYKAEDRYRTAKELASDLQNWLDDEPVGAWREPWVIRAWRWVKRHRTGVVAAAMALLVAVLVLLVANGFLKYANVQTAKALDTAEQNLYLVRINQAAQAFDQQSLNGARELLSQCMPKSNEVDRRGREWYMLWKACHREVSTLRDTSINAMAVSPDGSTVATGGDDGTVRLWNVSTGRRTLLTGHSSRVTSILFAKRSDTGEVLLASVGPDLKVWDVATAKERFKLQDRDAKPPQAKVTGLAISPDGQMLATADEDNMVTVVNTMTGDRQWNRELHSANDVRIISLALSKDGRSLAGIVMPTINFEHKYNIVIWDSASGDQLASISDRIPDEIPSFYGTPPRASLAYCPSDFPEGQILAVGFGNTLSFWDPQTAIKWPYTLKWSDGNFDSLAFSANGKLLLAGNRHGLVQLWRQANPSILGAKDGDLLSYWGPTQKDYFWFAFSPITSFKGHDNAIAGLDFLPHGNGFVSASHNGDVKIWDTSTEAQALKMQLDDWNRESSSLKLDFITKKAAFSSDATQLAYETGNGHIKVLDANGRSRAFKSGLVDSRPLGFSCLSFSSDGTFLAAGIPGHVEFTAGLKTRGSSYSTINYWNLVTTGDELSSSAQAFVNPTQRPTAVAISSAGMSVAAAALDAKIRIWDIAADAQPEVLDAGTVVVSLAYSPNGKFLASGTERGTLQLWNVENRRRVLETEKVNTKAIGTVTMSPDSAIVAAGAVDGAIVIWETNGSKPRTLAGHSHFVTTVSFSSDGECLATGSYDGTVKLWDVKRGDQLISFPKRPRAIVALAFRADGRTLAVLSEDGVVTVWPAATEEEVRASMTPRSSSRQQALSEPTDGPDQIGFDNG